MDKWKGDKVFCPAVLLNITLLILNVISSSAFSSHHLSYDFGGDSDFLYVLYFYTCGNDFFSLEEKTILCALGVDGVHHFISKQT